MFIYFIAPSLIFKISDLTSGIGCEKFESGVIWSSNDDENIIKSCEFKPSLWTTISPIEGWNAPPDWIELLNKNK